MRVRSRAARPDAAHDARRTARVEGDELVLLQDQDRSRWDADQLEEARQLLTRHRRARSLRAAGRDRGAPHRGPWTGRRSPLWYAELADLTGSPVVELNRAVALAQTGANERALELVDGLGADLDRYPYLHSTRAELLRRLRRSTTRRGRRTSAPST